MSETITSDDFDDLRAWLMEPQRHWLRRLGIRPGEWDRAIEDLETLELGERERAALLRQQLANSGVSAAAPAAATTAAEATAPPDWLALSRGQGRLPPRAAGQLEARALAERWSSLQDCLRGLGPARQEVAAWHSWQATLSWCADAVVLVHAARPTTPQRMELWLQLLLAAAAAPEPGRAPRQGILIARDGDRFGVQLQLAAPEMDAARSELQRLALLCQEWRGPCWPVPPLSGWAWLQGERKQAGSGWHKASEAWEGGFNSSGERLRPEMVVCFGAELPAQELLEAPFGTLAETLYGPVLEAMA